MNILEFLVTCFELLDLFQRGWFRGLLKVVLLLAVFLALFLGLCWLVLRVAKHFGV